MTHVTLIHAERMWIEACAHVSDGTRASYAGESRRFREYLGEAGVLEVREITEGHWHAYLANLTQTRSAAITKRADALKPSSALQAARITRSFLRHCWMWRWLPWVPDVGNRRCPDMPPQPEFQAPDGLVGFLLDAGERDDEAQSRQRCAVGLAFWGGFRPRELAALRARDLQRSDDGGAMLHPAWRASGVALPEIMVQHLLHYAALRVERAGPLVADTALIAQLTSSSAVSSSAAWQLLKDWTVAYCPPGGQPSSTRAIRESFKQLAGADAAVYIQAIERQAASRRRVVRSPAGEAVSAAQIAADLVRKMASTVAVV